MTVTTRSHSEKSPIPTPEASELKPHQTAQQVQRPSKPINLDCIVDVKQALDEELVTVVVLSNLVVHESLSKGITVFFRGRHAADGEDFAELSCFDIDLSLL